VAILGRVTRKQIQASAIAATHVGKRIRRTIRFSPKG
jgi:hypothetical protein